MRVGRHGDQNLLDGDEPDAEPAIHEETAVVDESAAVTGEEDRAELVEPRAGPTVEGYLNWLIERCRRRRDNATTSELRLLYEERVTILYGLK